MTTKTRTASLGSGRWTVLDIPGMEHLTATDAAGRALPVQREDGSLVIDGGGATGPVTLAAGVPPDGPSRISIEPVAEYQGQESYRIVTEGCTWIWHRHGGGWASMIDPDGKDWLSFRPFGGSDGIYRGIPNLAHPNNVFHAGHETCITTLTAEGPLRATLDVQSRDGTWACRWHVYSDHAELIVIRVGHPYWLLYEGTPWGDLDAVRDWCLRSDGLQRPLTESWDEVLPEPKWIAFGKDGVDRVLWLRSHSPENADKIDSFWPMEGNMTVFGFGRSGGKKFMTHVPARFTVGLTEATEHAALAAHIAHVTER